MIGATFREPKITPLHNKFHHVASSQPPSTASLVRGVIGDVIRAPSQEASYDTLRETLICRKTVSG